MTDKKEHHFCFAYKGERMRVTPFDELHFANVQGTSTLDGIQLVRVTLQRRNGRRASTIPKIIQDYNTLSGTDPVSPTKVASELICCFKITQPFDGNPILLRIEADRLTSSRYWVWDAQETGTTAKKSKKGSFAGLEGLVRELNLDPAVLCMQSAYDQISKIYFQVHGVELKNSGTFPAKDKEFILKELRRHFDRERMYVVSPNIQKELTPAAKAITETAFMDDLKFKATQDSADAPNSTVLKYFAEILSEQRGDITVSFKSILANFNSESMGIYRRTCIIPFMTPFVSTGAVEVADQDHLLIHTQMVADQIKK